MKLPHKAYLIYIKGTGVIVTVLSVRTYCANILEKQILTFHMNCFQSEMTQSETQLNYTFAQLDLVFNYRVWQQVIVTLFDCWLVGCVLQHMNCLLRVFEFGKEDLLKLCALHRVWRSNIINVPAHICCYRQYIQYHMCRWWSSSYQLDSWTPLITDYDLVLSHVIMLLYVFIKCRLES